MADFYTVNVQGGFRHINLDLVRYYDQASSTEEGVTLHFGPNDDVKLEAANGEARRFLNEMESRWRKAAAKAA
jgi:hypothetical protein